MAGKKLTNAGISALTTPTDDDLFYAVDDPSGTPTSKKITWANIVATIKAYYDAVASTLTNKTLSDSTTVIGYVSDLTKALKFSLGSATAGKTLTITSAHTNNRTWTIPDATDTSVGKDTTDTLTNKRIKKRVVSTTQSATPTINTDNGDIFEMTGLAQAITSLTTNLSGTPNKGDVIQMWITDNGTARAITPGASFAGTAEYPLAGLTTTVNKRLMLLWEYTTIWELVGKLNQA